MIIYTTLKANRENNVDFVTHCDECVLQIGRLFGKGTEYMDKHDYTDWDKLYNDFTEKQIESHVLKALKEDAKDREEGCFFKYGSFLIDREFAYDDVLELVKKGLIKRSDCNHIERQSKKYNFKIMKEDWGDDGYWHTYRMEDIVDEYFPCPADDDGGVCVNCCNCD